MGIIIPKLLDAILEATAVEAGAKARIAGLRAALEDEARRRWAAEGAAPSWNAPKAGKVRFDPPGDWTAQVGDADGFGSFVAEHYPSEATAVIRLPAADLPAALEALTFAVDTEVDTAIEVRPAWATTYLGGLVVEVEETPGETPEDPVERDVTIVDDRGLLPVGLIPTRSSGKLVVSLDRDRRTVVLDESRRAAEEAVADATEQGDAPAVDPALLDTRRRELEALHGDQLATIAKAHNLGSSGTKAALAERIARAEQATGLVVNPATTIPGQVHRATTEERDLARGIIDKLGPIGEAMRDVGPPEVREAMGHIDALAGPAEEPTEAGAKVLPFTAPAYDDDRPGKVLAEQLNAAEALADGRSREVLRAAAKARGLSAAGTKADVALTLAANGVTPADLTETATLGARA